MVDIHCHILPEVDDGAKTWDVAVEMCHMAQRDGIEHVVATPHANEEYRYDREQHEERLARLRELISGAIQLSLGCDFHLSYENIRDALKNPGRYCIGNSPYLLVEFSDFSLPPNVPEVFAAFLQIGVIPIITHPERNPILQHRPNMILDWVARGALVQVTANSMSGRWGGRALQTAEFLVRHQAVHVLATDAHGLRSRPPILSKAREIMADLAGSAAAKAMVDRNPRLIVNGEPLM